ncbi:MAG: polyprenyl diphosphate synthase [Phycisphaerae bacterium]|nr:polyprenyl diphosphate synthase [Phycisphaerae bacterium]
MDGNGRWARARNLPRSAGHQAGADVVEQIVTAAAELGLDALTLYSFSVENWRRPKEEVQMLMYLYAEYLRQQRQTQLDHNLRLRHVGRREGLPQSLLDELDRSVELSADNTGMFLCLALNYGSRAEITDAVRRIASRVREGLPDDAIDEKLISDSLDTHGVPDPDLLVRTAGEIRLSNFLLWQISYAELYVTDKHWPEYTRDEFHKSLHAFAARSRRFGGLDSTNT